ncbi:jhy protein homolog [Corythoichthys intestinalis]|uniref:jhy protein homolog n=1 Tax=Corythoichthys intestinalis TaxID=161448 RepID=UPI0025A55D97|nr:jhy protein homolog [Corythoichthys intestinalis]
MHNGDYMRLWRNMDDSLEGGIWEVVDANDDPSDDNLISDSINIDALSHRIRDPGSDTQKSKLDASVYSELGFDPKWSNTTKEDAITGSLIDTVPKHHPFSRQMSSQSEKQFIRGYRYIGDTSSTTVTVPRSDYNQPYHLHPQEDQISLMTTQLNHNDALYHSSPKSNLSRSWCDSTTQKQLKNKTQTSFSSLEDNFKRPLELPEDMEATPANCLKEYQNTYNQKELQQSTTKETIGKKKRYSQTEDLVERNKITLGRSTSGYGSYVNMFALQQKKPHILNKLHKTADVVATAAFQKESSNPELSLIQQLEVTHINDGSKEQVNTEPSYRSMEKSPELQSTHASALKCHFPIEECEQKWGPNEDCNRQSLEVFAIPSSTSHNTGVYTKLPPIMPEQFLSQSVKAIKLQHINSTPDFLAQMEDKIRKKANYKIYSLREYKELKLDVKLQGLGPDYTAVKKLAEKVNQQKLYSKSVRERNKNMSKMPFLLPKDPVVKDRKVARIKALEYAKTIAKPLTQHPLSKSSKKPQSGSSNGHKPCLEDWKISQPATVDLVKRHQEEKEALFKKVHVV